MAAPAAVWYTDISSKRTKTETEEETMKAMKYVLTVVLVLAAIIAAQMGLTGLIGFRTAELMGKTAVTALCLYAVIRVCQAFRVKRKAGKAQG